MAVSDKILLYADRIMKSVHTDAANPEKKGYNSYEMSKVKTLVDAWYCALSEKIDRPCSIEDGRLRELLRACIRQNEMAPSEFAILGITSDELYAVGCEEEARRLDEDIEEPDPNPESFFGVLSGDEQLWTDRIEKAAMEEAEGARTTLQHEYGPVEF